MNHKLLDTSSTGQRTFALVFDAGDEVLEGMKTFAREQKLGASQFTAVGALSEAELGFFEISRQDYHRIPVGEQVEVLVMAGDVTLKDDEPKVHAHIVLGKRDGTAVGGHLLSGKVRPTLEVMLTESPAPLRRRHDERFGLPLIEL